MDKYRVTLEAEERTALEQLVSTGKSASRKLTHARILLLADAERGAGHTDESAGSPAAILSNSSTTAPLWPAFRSTRSRRYDSARRSASRSTAVNARLT